MSQPNAFSLFAFPPGYFAMDVEAEQGDVFALYFFQMSFATTATTIVSGAMAERTHLHAYTIYSFTNTISYVFPHIGCGVKKAFSRSLVLLTLQVNQNETLRYQENIHNLFGYNTPKSSEA